MNWCFISLKTRSREPSRPASYKNVIAIPCIVDEPRLSTFSYTTPYTCICQLVWLIYCFKIISSLMQVVWVSSYIQTDWSWPLIIRTIRLQQRDHSFRYSVFLHLQSWLCIGMFCKSQYFVWVQVRMVCEVVSGYICNMVIHLAEGKKLEDTVLSLLDRNLGQNHYIYQDGCYNSVKLAQTLLDRYVRVHSTMRAKRGIPCDLEGEGKCL
jgi:hypothetical protein